MRKLVGQRPQTRVRVPFCGAGPRLRSPKLVRERLVQKWRLTTTALTLSSYSSTTKSKRYSLGIVPASPCPRPLHHLDGTITSSSSASASSPSPSTSASIGKASKRQSSVSCPPDGTLDYYTSISITLNNAARSPSSVHSTKSVHVGARSSRRSSVGSGSPALKARYGVIQRMSLPLEKEERPPLPLLASALLSFFFFSFSDLRPQLLQHHNSTLIRFSWAQSYALHVQIALFMARL